MLQTQKFSPEYVEKIISEIEKSTSELHILLTSEEEYYSKLNKILEVLDKREHYFKEFEKVPQNENLNLYFRNNHNKWLDRVKKILDKEKINLEIIEKNMKTLSEKVKDINKQKQLLLYMKREV